LVFGFSKNQSLVAVILGQFFSDSLRKLF
jgi:hypothetical protein